MIYYFLEIIASLTFALGFGATKYYQKFTRNNLISSVVFLLIFSIFSFIVIFAINGFKLAYEPLSFVLALVLAIICIFYYYIAILILKYGSMSVYSQFMMLGGMILPYFFGVIVFNESLSDLKIVGLIILVLSLCLTMKVDKMDSKKKTIIYISLCLLAFLLNGAVSITSSIQGNASIKWDIPTTNMYDYMLWRNLFSIAIGIPLLFILLIPKKKREENIESIKESISIKPFIGAIVYTIVNNVGGFLQLYCVPFIDQSILFPISTGGTVAFSTLLGFILYKEKANKLTIICLFLTIISTIIFMFGGFYNTTYIVDFLKNIFR